MKRLAALCSALAMFMVMALPASAVKYGTEDTANTFDGVGMLLFTDGTGLWVCSGTLIDPDSVLTAGHCTDGAIAAWATFSLDPLPQFLAALGVPNGATPAMPGVPKTYNGFSFTSFPNTGDVGLVNLLSPATGVNHWPIASAGTLDGLATKRGVKNVTFDLVGYGTQATNGLGLEGNMNFDYLAECVESDRPGCRQDTFLWARYFGMAKLTNLNSANTAGYNVQVSAAKGTGGALCFGDSGGPVLYEGEIVAVNSFVLNLECAGAGFSYRVDRPEIIEWININT